MTTNRLKRELKSKHATAHPINIPKENIDTENNEIKKSDSGEYEYHLAYSYYANRNGYGPRFVFYYPKKEKRTELVDEKHQETVDMPPKPAITI